MIDTIFSFFSDPLVHQFMQRALFSSILIGIVCSIFSCFLILKGWSLMGDAVSHAVLPGLAIAYVINIPLAIGAFIAGLFCSLATGYLKENSRVKEDAIMGIVFSGMFAFGIVLLTKIETDVHLIHVLFGNILGITQQDFIEAGIVSVLCSSIMLIKRRDFMLFCFDPAQAHVLGFRVKLLHFGLLVLLSLTIVSALKAAGIILVIAMLIAPGAIGFLVTRSFDRMLMIAVSVSVISCFMGTILSFHLDTATAPLIIVIQSTFFIGALIVGKNNQSFREGLNKKKQPQIG